MKRIKLNKTSYSIDKNQTVTIPINKDTVLVISCPELFALSQAAMSSMLEQRKVPATVMETIQADIESRRKKPGKPAEKKKEAVITKAKVIPKPKKKRAKKKKALKKKTRAARTKDAF